MTRTTRSPRSLPGWLLSPGLALALSVLLAIGFGGEAARAGDTDPEDGTASEISKTVEAWGGEESAPEAEATVDPDAPADAGDAEAAGPYRLEELSWVIDSFLAKRDLSGARVGILVESLVTGEVLFARNAGTAMTPASNMKVVTGAAALSILGPNYRFRTEFSTDGAIDGAFLGGNVYVLGSGDPSIVSEELWKIVEEFRLRGIERITGDIVLDASFFDSVAATSDDVANGQRAYHARTGALALNFSSVAVHVYPGSGEGSQPRVALAPGTSFVDVRNEATTGSSRRSSTLSVVRTYASGRNVVTVSGRIPAGSRRTVVYRNLEDPVLYFGTVMKEFLAVAGVAVEGIVRTGPVPSGTALLFTHRSKPLSLVVRDLNKFSNNFVAEQLVKTLGAEMEGPPGTTDSGQLVLGRFLSTAGAASGSYRVFDGSGFSRENRLSPRTIVRVIRRTLDDFETSHEYAASLSVSGTDGTLEDRMGYAGLEGAVRAKTGLLDGVTAIAGIVRTLAGEDILFSIIVNDFRCEAWKVRDMEHAILTSIVSAAPGE